MPRTRPTESRDATKAAILEAAERRLRTGGYQALSVAAIARDLGLAQNTLYWYFASKDELFVATLRRILGQIAARKPAPDVGRVEQILWFTDQFQELSDLRGPMNDRARESAIVASFVQELEALLSRMLSNALSEYLSADELPLAVETFRATVEGTFVKGLDRRARRRVLTFALERLIAEQAPPSNPWRPGIVQ